mgnify:CR=1 FL=1
MNDPNFTIKGQAIVIDVLVGEVQRNRNLIDEQNHEISVLQDICDNTQGESGPTNMERWASYWEEAGVEAAKKWQSDQTSTPTSIQQEYIDALTRQLHTTYLLGQEISAELSSIYNSAYGSFMDIRDNAVETTFTQDEVRTAAEQTLDRLGEVISTINVALQDVGDVVPNDPTTETSNE